MSLIVNKKYTCKNCPLIFFHIKHRGLNLKSERANSHEITETENNSAMEHNVTLMTVYRDNVAFVNLFSDNSPKV